jgi:hypothetical protein
MYLGCVGGITKNTEISLNENQIYNKSLFTMYMR